MERATLARPYAEAVAKLAAERGDWDTWSRRLALLARVTGDAQIQDLAGNPAMTTSRLADVILSVCGDELGAEGQNLARLLAENKRLALLPEIGTLFEAAKALQEGVLEAHITTAYELTAAQMTGLVARLESKFGRKVHTTQSVAADLIGGVLIQVGDEIMDASVRGGLENLAATLKA
jgi:F-type H+-transporting ATPase subunit delta